ncbi:hypothetical protein BHE90_005999 [Fusarium euwallaceae]|uniref:Uncharacterized protein n=4 Tax=Fusarium solani species complex TaxID=232080 RepID=A0A3M2SRB9_9HYPO|nr:hypothetical protein CDV36_000258 [Fusarium kuroshium]RSL87139.1 hypothetical protein CEP51_002424 [Fusarium floridanum]RSM20120.1 hypothetical protein CDV31_000915 [Fusarium ambrosium]RTE79530.1 hypothetical protein BHE90_005999 [Fusarium euwallaceae]
MKDERVSDHIRFPRYSYRVSRRTDGVSGYNDVMGRAVLICIINDLADVVDAVEDLRLPSRSEERARLRIERRKMCDLVIKGANDLTAIFDSVKAESKYTDLAPKNLPKYRNEICGQLLNPLRKSDPRRATPYGRPFSFNPYREKLRIILSGIERELRRWLKVPREEPRKQKHGTQQKSRSHRGSSPPNQPGLCTVM